MRAITLVTTEQSSYLTLSNAQHPIATGTQVLIQVAACGINRPDLLQRQGLYPPPAGASDILGLEVAGTIVEIGDQVNNFKLGDQVCALVSGGAYAEYCLADQCCCLPIPASLSLIEAAALPETFFTVWSNLFMRGQFKAGESVLIHGGGSGIGTTAIQLLKAFGGTVYVTAGTEEKCLRCIAIGADEAIHYQQNDFVQAIENLTEGRGVNMILDMIAGDYFPANLKCLAIDGRLVQIAIQHGAKSEINLWTVMIKRLTIMGTTLRNRDNAFKTEIASQLQQQVWPLLAAGRIKPIIDSVWPIDNAELAHQRMASNLHFGKIILEF